MFKPTVNVEENKGDHSSKDCHRWCQKHEELVLKKHELAERQAAAAAQRSQQQEATAGAPVIPDAALSNSADADLNNHIEEIENDMQQTFEKFENIGISRPAVLSPG
jgi:hypothetical protein